MEPIDTTDNILHSYSPGDEYDFIEIFLMRTYFYIFLFFIWTFLFSGTVNFLFMVKLEEEDVLDTIWFQKQMLKKRYQDKKQDRFNFKFLIFFRLHKFISILHK